MYMLARLSGNNARCSLRSLRARSLAARRLQGANAVRMPAWAQFSKADRDDWPAILLVIWNRANRLFYRVVGAPPTRHSSPEQSFRWVRRLYTRWLLPLLVTLWVVVAVVGVATWLWILGGIGTVWFCVGLLLVNLRIQRERQSRQDQSGAGHGM